MPERASIAVYALDPGRDDRVLGVPLPEPGGVDPYEGGDDRARS